MSDATQENKKPDSVKAHCPTCDADRTCDVHGKINKTWSWEDRGGRYSFDGGTEHFLLECRGCETVFYLTDSWNSEDMDHYYGPDGEELSEPARNRRSYPSPASQTKPIWFDALVKIDPQLQNVLNEIYLAYDQSAYILTAVGLRTALDRATEVLGIDPAISFDEKLARLKTGGWIGATEHDVLDVITNAGNAAAHRGWSPSKEDVGKLLIAMEAFLHRAFIVGQDALAIRANIPPRPRRQTPASQA